MYANATQLPLTISERDSAVCKRLAAANVQCARPAKKKFSRAAYQDRINDIPLPSALPAPAAALHNDADQPKPRNEGQTERRANARPLQQKRRPGER